MLGKAAASGNRQTHFGIYIFDTRSLTQTLMSVIILSSALYFISSFGEGTCSRAQF